MTLKDKKFILGVTGSIASYKSCELLRKLKKEGAEVKVVMTKNATQFVGPLTFQTLSKNPVYWDMFEKPKINHGKGLRKRKSRQDESREKINFQRDKLVHIKLTEWADIVLVAPATANIIAKTACGVADDLLSTLLVSFQGPIVFAPAMDEGMYRNIIFKENVNKLKEKGYHIIPAIKGALASGKVGKGRLPALEEILEKVRKILSSKPARPPLLQWRAGGEDFKGVKVLITAGGTQEFIDPVRFIGNSSSGKMGYALAEAAKSRGADVRLVSAPTLLSAPVGIEVINVVSAGQMRNEVIKKFNSSDILIMAAAVGDFKPQTFIKQKRKRANGHWDITLVPNPDILSEIGKIKKNKITVGFSIETEGQIIKAKEKLKRKRLDLIVANDIMARNSGFCSDTNKAVFIDKKGKIEKLPLFSKRELADKIFDKIQNIRRNRWKGKK